MSRLFYAAAIIALTPLDFDYALIYCRRFRRDFAAAFAAGAMPCLRRAAMSAHARQRWHERPRRAIVMRTGHLPGVGGHWLPLLITSIAGHCAMMMLMLPMFDTLDADMMFRRCRFCRR